MMSGQLYIYGALRQEAHHNTLGCSKLCGIYVPRTTVILAVLAQDNDVSMQLIHGVQPRTTSLVT